MSVDKVGLIPVALMVIGLTMIGTSVMISIQAADHKDRCTMVGGKITVGRCVIGDMR